MRITIDAGSLDAGLAAALAGIQDGLEAGVGAVADQVARAAMKNLKGDPRGKHLLSSIHTEVKAYYDFATAQVGVGGATGIDGEAGENFGIYVHEGTGIYSRTGMGRKDVPWFYWDEDYIGHLTSGMEANPFLEDAYNEVAPEAPAILAAALGMK